MPLITSTDEVRRLLHPNYDSCDSLTLRLEKFVCIESDNKIAEIKRICDCAARKGVVRQPTQCFHRIPGAREFVMQLQSRLLVNHSGGILENTGLCLHRFFGAPMVPGSSLKGIARRVALDKVRQAKTVSEKSSALRQTALAFGWADNDWQKNSDFQIVAGDDLQAVWQDCASSLLKELHLPLPKKYEETPWKALGSFCGTVAFLPAVAECPEGSGILEADLVNCHHPEYYQSTDARRLALDIENPVPNFFPAVRAGLDFVFTLAPTPGAAMRLPDIDSHLNFAQDCLRRGLSEHGAGAKTNAGYGWFEENQTATEQLAQQREEEQKEAEEEAALAKMTPEERAVKDFVENKLQANDREGDLKGKMARIDQLPEEEQRIICRAIQLNSNFKKIWKNDCIEAGRAKGPDDKKFGKAYKRVQKVWQAAKKLGVAEELRKVAEKLGVAEELRKVAEKLGEEMP
jgi:CRISPR-associated protein Cmr6